MSGIADAPIQTAADIAEHAAAGTVEESVSPKADHGGADKVCCQLKAFLSGTVIPLKEVNDGVFSEGILGDGLAIIPESEILCAPIGAEVAALMPESRHACGLRLDNGMEILLHIGLNTVEMKGDGFEYLVEEGQKVKTGTPLIRFNRQKIQEAGYPDVTVCIISNPGDAKNIQFNTGIHAVENDTTITTFELE